MDKYQESALTEASPDFYGKLTLSLGSSQRRQSICALEWKKYAQARWFFLAGVKRAKGLAKPSNGLASRYAGLGLGATPKSKPKPEKARLHGRKPVLQAENVTLNLKKLEKPRLSTDIIHKPERQDLN
ncbi:hypothetical protein B0H13DRAFT_1867140 [Mycena leptocephala]|nr:hypothetical protein B0H13DRAFT_1867140 [Mycena leptocephala]